MGINIEIMLLDDNARIPDQKHLDDAGYDLYACLKEPVELVFPGTTVAIPTGFAVAIEPSTSSEWVWSLDIRPKSGLALNKSLSVLNSPGTCDQSYRGEVQVIVHNHGRDVIQIAQGQKIAQCMLTKCYKPTWIQVSSLNETKRGAGGFGSTGLTSN